MISPPLQRADLAKKLGMKGKELTAAIREMKKCGRLILRSQQHLIHHNRRTQ